MALAYQAFLKKGIDLAPLGLETNGAFISYFCTPKGAKVLGWAGVDGIHYCTIRGFGDMIFAVSPMNVGDYVHPIARNFEDLLRLLLSCTDMAALEQCYAWDEEQYKAFLMDCPATPKQQAVLDAIRSKTSLEPMEDAFHYVKQLQAEFDLSAIPYTEDYYDEDMNPDNQFRMAGVKLIGDGSVSGRTAWCDVPYLDSENPDKLSDEYGIPVCTPEDIESAKAFCKEHGCQLSIHAMGARTIDRAVGAGYGEKSWLKDNFKKTPYLRIEHVAMPTADAIKKAAEAGIAFVTQPIFLYAEIESYLTNMGLERTQTNYPIKDFIESGVQFSFSTDAPATAWATPSEPFACLKGAVTRKAYDGTDCGQEHRVDIETAIILYTAESAPMLGFEKVGMLKDGFAADFIVLDKDVLNIPAEEIDTVTVEETYVAGECVYRK